jgi:cytochrome b561
MRQFKNTYNRFGLVAKTLHWLIAILIIGMLTVGLYMKSLPKSPIKFQLYDLHKAVGIVVLTLVIVRILWRFINITPALVMPLWERIAARASHYLLYIIMLAMPMSGWLMNSAADYPVSFFGLFTLPKLILPNETAYTIFNTAHTWLAYSLIGLIILHVAAALKHHFWDNDDILRRMI